MDIGFDQHNWRVQPESQGDDGIEWHALRARLSAAYAARTALTGNAGANGEDTSRSGCFDLISARSVAAYDHALAGVNRTALGNGKSEIGKDAGASGKATAGGRG